jgi:hypothetical protein
MFGFTFINHGAIQPVGLPALLPFLLYFLGVISFAHFIVISIAFIQKPGSAKNSSFRAFQQSPKQKAGLPTGSGTVQKNGAVIPPTGGAAGPVSLFGY